MEPEDRKLLYEIHGKVCEIDGRLPGYVDAVKGLDRRTRELEVGHAEHRVKIGGIQAELVNLWRRVRYSAPKEKGASWFLPVVEFLTSAPSIAHFLVGGGALLSFVAGTIWRHFYR